MDINSAVKRNNPVWNKETTQANFTLPAGPGFSFVTDGTNSASYIMITNTSTAVVDIINLSVSGARGIPLAPGATFECAVDITPPPTAGTMYGIGVKTNAGGGEVITVTYFLN